MRSRSADLVVLEAVADPEAVAERGRKQPRPCGRADERERGKVERHRAGTRTLAEDDRQPAVLHRRVERLLDRSAQPVDLVDEEDASGLEGGQERRDVGLALHGGPGRLHERRLHLGGDDVGQRRLAEARRPREQHVIERLVAPAGRLDEDGELVGDLGLADEVLEARGPERAVEVVVGADSSRIVDQDLLVGPRCLDPLAGRDAHAAPWLPLRCEGPSRSALRRCRPRRGRAGARPRRACSRGSADPRAPSSGGPPRLPRSR